MNWKENILTIFKKLGVKPAFYAALYRRFFQLVNMAKYRDPYFFRGVFIETSTYCNRRCEYCPNSVNPMPRHFMTQAVYEKIIEQLAAIKFSGTLCYHFFNEPLLDDRLAGFVAHARRRLPGCIHRIYTNGDLLTEDKAGALIEAGVCEFIITIHDPDENKMRAKLENIAEKYPNRLNIQSIRGGSLSNIGGAVKVQVREERKACVSYLENLMIDYEGNVLLCCHDFYRRHKFGNIMQENITDIWNKPTFRKLRRELRHGIARLDICRKCLNQEG